MNLSFQKIGVHDIQKLREMAIATFRETYEALNDPNEFEDYINKSFHKEQLDSEINNADSHFYFVSQNEEKIGYFKLNLGNAQTEKMPDQCIELERIYLYQKYQGNGIGARMIQECERIAKRLRAKKLWLGVWVQNEGAIQFYKKMGYKIFDKHYFIIGDDHQTDYMMEKLL